jgi:hypothetical protein
VSELTPSVSSIVSILEVSPSHASRRAFVVLRPPIFSLVSKESKPVWPRHAYDTIRLSVVADRTDGSPVGSQMGVPRKRPRFLRDEVLHYA